jgi:hypothetical protein
MRAVVGRVWIASCAVLTCMGALNAACSTRGSSDVATRVSAADVDVQPHQSDGTASDVASIVGTWEFAALTGVPPAELPPGSVPDNRRDLVIRNDGSFRWGTWFGHVDGSGTEFALFIARPADLRQRFDDFGASVSISIVGHRMQIWLPDLGQDRDVDFGDAVEDIDSPDMEFRRVRG